MSGRHRAIQETNKARIGVAGALMHTGKRNGRQRGGRNGGSMKTLIVGLVAGWRGTRQRRGRQRHATGGRGGPADRRRRVSATTTSRRWSETRTRSATSWRAAMSRRRSWTGSRQPSATIASRPRRSSTSRSPTSAPRPPIAIDPDATPPTRRGRGRPDTVVITSCGDGCSN